jgi:hypothetical protein
MKHSRYSHITITICFEITNEIQQVTITSGMEMGKTNKLGNGDLPNSGKANFRQVFLPKIQSRPAFFSRLAVGNFYRHIP